MKFFICLVFFFWAIPHGFAQLNFVPFEQIESLQKAEKRNVIIFIHTDWCQYCKVMKNKTFKNEEVIKMMNEKFYFVDFNAEDKRNIVFNNAIYDYNRKGNNAGVHELAVQLGTVNKQISYPTLCVLNDKNEIIFQYSSFLNARNLLNMLEKLY